MKSQIFHFGFVYFILIHYSIMDQYEVGRELGYGAFGVAKLVTRKKDKQKCVMKQCSVMYVHIRY